MPRRSTALRESAVWFVLLAGIALTLFATTQALVAARSGFLLDLQVFQDAGRALRTGADLYSDGFPTRSGFRFIYPPFAVVLFGPLAYLDPTMLQVVWTAATIVAVWAILAMVASRVRLRRPALVALALTGVALLMEPIRSNLEFGQVNVFLFLLVTADVLGFTPRRFRGMLVGLAAGIKVTPAAFALLFLVRRDWASLLRSIGTVAITAAVGHLVRPADSTFFWTVEFFATDRAGDVFFVPNQALSGLLARAFVPDPPAGLITGVFFVVVAAAAGWGAWRFTRSGRHVDAFLLVAIGVFVASPVAVTHHWSGLIIALPVLLAVRRPSFRVALALLVLAHLVGTHYVYEFSAESPAEHVLQWLGGNAQGWTGIVTFGVLLLDALRPGNGRGTAGDRGGPPSAPPRRLGRVRAAG